MRFWQLRMHDEDGAGGGDDSADDAAARAEYDARQLAAEGGGGDDDDGGDDDQGGGDGGDDDLNLDLEGIDDDKVLRFLKSKGIEFDGIENLTNLKKNLGGVTTKHQDALGSLEALRLGLGEDYDSALARGTRKKLGQEDSGGGDGFDVAEPEHFKNFSPEVRKEIDSTFDYNFKKQMKVVIPQIVEGLMNHIDERDHRNADPEYDTKKEAYDQIRKEHGITGRSAGTLKLLDTLYKEKTSDALSDLAGNEGKPRVKGSPPPKGGSRGARPASKLETDADFEKEFNRRQAASQKG